MATLTRRKPLAVVPRVVCPAAVPIAGAVSANSGVICRVMQMDRDREQGAGLTPAQHAMTRDGSDGVLLTAKSDPSTIERFCCGTGLPVLHDGEHPGGRDTPTYCPVWQAEKKRIAEGRKSLRGGGLVPETVGVDPATGEEITADDVRRERDSESDPWARARKDLDVLAPREIP